MPSAKQRVESVHELRTSIKVAVHRECGPSQRYSRSPPQEERQTLLSNGRLGLQIKPSPQAGPLAQHVSLMIPQGSHLSVPGTGQSLALTIMPASHGGPSARQRALDMEIALLKTEHVLETSRCVTYMLFSRSRK
jgi:hypothetical protein